MRAPEAERPDRHNNTISLYCYTDTPTPPRQTHTPHTREKTARAACGAGSGHGIRGPKPAHSTGQLGMTESIPLSESCRGPLPCRHPCTKLGMQSMHQIERERRRSSPLSSKPG